jgi:hypothetical protein
MYYDQPPASVQQIAELRSSTSRCLITLARTDNENGDPIIAHCGARNWNLAETLKGADAQTISPCHVVIIVNAVHEPKVLDIKNCRGHLGATDVGRIWLSAILKKTGIAKTRIEYVSYAPLAGSLGCYRVAVTFDARPGAKDTSFGEKSGTFCISGADRGQEGDAKSDLSGTKTAK